MLRRPAFLALLFLLGARAARAQTAPTLPRIVTRAAALVAPGVAEQMGQQFQRGFFDAMLARADQLSASGQPLEPKVLYWRGLAHYRLGHYARARADLEAAQKGGVEFLPGGYNVTAVFSTLGRIEPLLPALQTEVKDGDRTLFEVHYSRLDAGTNTVLELLPQAYQINRELLGADIEATAVYVFDTRDHFRDFYQEWTKHPPGSWISAVTVGDVVYICLQRPDGSMSWEDHPQHFRGTVAHEFNHAMMNRLVGATALPSWFKEGVAQIAGTRLSPGDLAANDRDVQRMFGAHLVLSPQDLETHEDFAAQTEAGVYVHREDGAQITASPYAQSYSMARALVKDAEPDALPNLLRLTREEDDFKQGFLIEFGLTVPQFYNNWYEDTARTLKH